MPRCPGPETDPHGSIWQRDRPYRLPDRHGVARVYLPPGTRWWNPLGGWVTSTPGISHLGPGLPFCVSCHGPDDAKRF